MISSLVLLFLLFLTQDPRPQGRARQGPVLKDSASAASPQWRDARPDYRWSFPRDHWAHAGYRTEWWYFTGQLAAPGDSAPRFGYQFTLFRVGVLPTAPPWASGWRASDVIMGHAAVTDLVSGRHTFSETLVRATPLLGGFGRPGDSLVAWSVAPPGTDGRWTLRWKDYRFAFAMRDARRGIALDLTAEPARPLTLQGPNGYSRKGAAPGNASQYYSFTRLATSGTVTADGRAVRVSGTSWMDQEFGSNQLDPAAAGWDWFSLQLGDGRDVMLYQLRDTTGAATWSAGTVIRPGAAPRYLTAADYQVRATAHWTSGASGARYPARWTVTIPSERLVLTVEPLLADQENRSAIATRLFYWEGAVRVRNAAGRTVGRGYVELTGYGTSIVPAI
jgi:predicted secreted hydrolase